MPSEASEPIDPDRFPRKETVKVSFGNIRSAPSTASRIIDKLSRSESVMLLYRRGGWYRVKLPDGALGWAHQTLFTAPVKDDDQKAAAEAGALNVIVGKGNIRRKPSMGAVVIAHVARNERVSLLETRKNWYRIRLPDGGTGWGHRSLFGPVAGTKTPVSAPTASATTSRKEWRELEEKNTKGHMIKFIRVDVAKQGEERVLFLLDGFFPPQTFVLEEGALRVVCDFPDTGLAPGIGRVIPVDGRLIKRIRTEQYLGDHPKVRAVVDLATDKEYEVNQFFFQEQNVYSVVIKEK